MSKEFKIHEYEVVYLSYDEPNAQSNWEDLLTKIPYAKRVHGIKGSDAAHKAVAKITTTPRVSVIDADTVIEHDSVIEDFVSIAPSATLAGNVTIGFRSVISMGSLVRQKISVGKDSVLGANSFLNTDLEDNVLAYGNPAKIIRKRVLGEPYLD